MYTRRKNYNGHFWYSRLYRRSTARKRKREKPCVRLITCCWCF